MNYLSPLLDSSECFISSSFPVGNLHKAAKRLSGYVDLTVLYYLITFRNTQGNSLPYDLIEMVLYYVTEDYLYFLAFQEAVNVFPENLIDASGSFMHPKIHSIYLHFRKKHVKWLLPPAHSPQSPLTPASSLNRLQEFFMRSIINYHNNLAVSLHSSSKKALQKDFSVKNILNKPDMHMLRCRIRMIMAFGNISFNKLAIILVSIPSMELPSKDQTLLVDILYWIMENVRGTVRKVLYQDISQELALREHLFDTFKQFYNPKKDVDSYLVTMSTIQGCNVKGLTYLLSLLDVYSKINSRREELSYLVLIHGTPEMINILKEYGLWHFGFNRISRDLTLLFINPGRYLMLEYCIQNSIITYIPPQIYMYVLAKGDIQAYSILRTYFDSDAKKSLTFTEIKQLLLCRKDTEPNLIEVLKAILDLARDIVQPLNLNHLLPVLDAHTQRGNTYVVQLIHTLMAP